jgi:hypothetical protein
MFSSVSTQTLFTWVYSLTVSSPFSRPYRPALYPRKAKRKSRYGSVDPELARVGIRGFELLAGQSLCPLAVDVEFVSLHYAYLSKVAFR